MASPSRLVNHFYIFLCGFFLGTLLAALFSRLKVNPHLADRDSSTEDNLFGNEKTSLSTTFQDENPAVKNDKPKSAQENSNMIVFVNDSHAHKDDTSLADTLYKEVKVLCWIMTSPTTIRSKGVAVKETWGKRCNKFLFANDHFLHDLPTMNISVPHGRKHLTAKTMKAFDYVYEHYRDDYDWFLKADDDTYIIMENLRYLLSAHSPNERVFFGHHFEHYIPQGYFSGGAGYVISKEALRLFSQREKNQCYSDGEGEDVLFAHCLAKVGVKPGESRDSLGRIRFHCFSAGMALVGKPPEWFKTFTKYKNSTGKEFISDYTISFHYLSPTDMAITDFFVYHLRPYGIITYPQEINGPPGRS